MNPAMQQIDSFEEDIRLGKPFSNELLTQMQYDLRSLDQSEGEKSYRGYFITCDPYNGEVVSSVLKKAKSGCRTDRFIHFEAEN